jgi:hypothetical protein
VYVRKMKVGDRVSVELLAGEGVELKLLNIDRGVVLIGVAGLPEDDHDSLKVERLPADLDRREKWRSEVAERRAAARHRHGQAPH